MTPDSGEIVHASQVYDSFVVWHSKLSLGWWLNQESVWLVVLADVSLLQNSLLCLLAILVINKANQKHFQDGVHYFVPV